MTAPLARWTMLAGAILTLSASPARAQSGSSFGAGEIEVVSEWRGEDRGDTSGTYTLVTTAVDPASGIAIEHALGIERTADGEEVDTETLRVLEDGAERARGESDPGALGAYGEAATAYVIPFAVDFKADPRKNYRPQQKKVAEIVHAVAADAQVSTRSNSDGRTTATVQISEVLPADALAERFVGIRRALRDADLGFAKLQIKGRAVAPAPAPLAAPEPPATPSPPVVPVALPPPTPPTVPVPPAAPTPPAVPDTPAEAGTS